MKILLFGGTAEGRTLALRLAGRRCGVVYCVATEYGAALLPEGENVEIHMGRLDRVEMEELMRSCGCRCAVDATHPYADVVSANIRAAAAAVGMPAYRLVRKEGAEEAGWLHAPDAARAAELLTGTQGNILLTTGSKDLPCYAVPGLIERVFPRVLPSMESLSRCLELGFPAAHVLCMQGPFSVALNAALLEQYQIKILVTKSTGAAGGFAEKAEAARQMGATLLVIDRPCAETGLELESMWKFLEKQLEEWQ